MLATARDWNWRVDGLCRLEIRTAFFRPIAETLLLFGGAAVGGEPPERFHGLATVACTPPPRRRRDYRLRQGRRFNEHLADSACAGRLSGTLGDGLRSLHEDRRRVAALMFKNAASRAPPRPIHLGLERSSGSPSSARVDGTKPKSKRKTAPPAIRFQSMSVVRDLLGVSMTTITQSSSKGSSRSSDVGRARRVGDLRAIF